MSSFMDKMNGTYVDPELLRAVMAAHAGLSAPDRCNLEARALRIFELLEERGFQGRQIAELTVAIEFRLTALARLTTAHGGRGFIHPGREPGMRRVAADLVRCAAEEPLVNLDDEPTFNIDSFELRLLAITAAQGEA